jgi:hypothetical protein
MGGMGDEMQNGGLGEWETNAEWEIPRFGCLLLRFAPSAVRNEMQNGGTGDKMQNGRWKNGALEIGYCEEPMLAVSLRLTN